MLATDQNWYQIPILRLDIGTMLLKEDLEHFPELYLKGICFIFQITSFQVCWIIYCYGEEQLMLIVACTLSPYVWCALVC